MTICKQNNKRLAVSIVPSFYCKTNCPYCYLGNLRTNKQVVPIDSVIVRLNQLIENDYTFDSISIYGGEISLFDQQYLSSLFQTAKQYCNNVGIATNGQNKQIFELCKQFEISPLVSLNQERPDYKRSLKLIKSMQCSVGVVVLPSVLHQTAEQFCQQFDQLQRDVYLFQYYQADNYSQFKFNNQQYIDWVVNLLQHYHQTKPHNFRILNETEWTDNCYNCDDSGFVYIMPNGQFATTSYQNCIESYKYFETVDQWEQYCHKRTIQRKIKCGTCQYFDQCKAEHVVVYNDPYCSGLKQIIKFYKNIKNTTYNSI